MRKLMWILLLLASFTFVFEPILAVELITLPSPTGEYGVGTCQWPLVDTSRTEVILKNSPTKYRELMLQLWYPIAKETVGIPTEYMDRISATFIANEITDLNPDFRLLIKTNSIPEAPFANNESNYPVLIFSPGYKATYLLYQSFFEDLASHGYIVVAINHPYISGITVFPDNHYYPPYTPKNEDKFIEDNFQTVITDIKFVIDQLKLINLDKKHDFYGKFDLTRIGCFGHSLGGAASVQACINYPEIKAAIDIDGSMYGKEYSKPHSKPIMLINNEFTGSIDFTTKNLWKNTREGYRVQILNARHYDYTDMGMIIRHLYPQELPRSFFGTGKLALQLFGFGKINPKLVVEITRTCVLNFFDIYIKDKTNQKLLDIPTSYPQQTKLIKKPKA